MDLKKQRIVFGILTIITFITIFIFSNQDGNSSSSTSRGVTEKVIEILQLNKRINEKEKNNLIEKSQFCIRKMAHFTIYTMVGINAFGFFNTIDIKNKNKIIFTLILGISYATTDEIHQMFSGGRTASIRDVFIDSCGVLFGIIILNKITIRLKMREKQNLNKLKKLLKKKNKIDRLNNI